MTLEEILEKNNEQLRALVNGYEKEIELLKTLLRQRSKDLDESLMTKEKWNKVLDAASKEVKTWPEWMQRPENRQRRPAGNSPLIEKALESIDECGKWPESMKKMHAIHLKADEYYKNLGKDDAEYDYYLNHRKDLNRMFSR